MSSYPALALPLPHESRLQQPFRFLDLPSELRNEVYKLLLCAIEDPPRPCRTSHHELIPEFARLRNHIEPQILRTCRRVFLEGSHVMKSTNLLIKLEIKKDPTELYRVLPEFGVPFFITKNEACLASLMQYKGFIMTYQIDHPGVLYCAHPVPHRLLILDRHLDLLCAALSHARWTVPDIPDKLVHHRITISEPKTCLAESESLPTAETGQLEYKLLSPFRRMLRGVSSVEISGRISEELRTATIADMSRAPTWDTGGLLNIIRQLIRDGKQFLEWNQHKNSYKMYDRGIALAANLMTAKVASEIRASGGDPFRDHLLELHFSLSCGLAETLLDQMHLPDEDGGLRVLALCMKEIVKAAWKFQNLHSQESVWKPAPQQTAKLFYRWAMACRVSLELEELENAESAIVRALSAMPGDLELLSEREKIAQWRASNLVTPPRWHP